MVRFSERQGYNPVRSQLHQYEEIDGRLRNAIWNFLLDRFFLALDDTYVEVLLNRVWTEVAGGRSDQLPRDKLGLRSYATVGTPLPAVEFIRTWYLKARWYEVYDVLEHVLRFSDEERHYHAANVMLCKEGSAYRFVGDVLVSITNQEEIAVVESVVQLSNQFSGASQHIAQAVTLLSDRNSPDYRNAIKESISAVESAVRVATGKPNIDIEKGLMKLGLHNQLEQAWKNMYNWTSDEDGVRHGIKGAQRVGMAEARYMVVASSAFVNYLVSKSTEGDSQ